MSTSIVIYIENTSNCSTIELLSRSWHRIGESGQTRGPCLRLKIISIPRFIATIAPASIARNAILTQIATRLRQISRCIYQYGLTLMGEKTRSIKRFYNALIDIFNGFYVIFTHREMAFFFNVYST